MKPKTMKEAASCATKYKKDMVEQVYKLCLLGATDKELADFFNISVQTLNNWKKTKPDFSDALKRGKQSADAEVADRLYKRATGFSCKAVKVFNNKGDPLIVDYTQHYPPDLAAITFWLKSRQPQKWRDKAVAEPPDAPEPLIRAIRRTIVTPASKAEKILHDEKDAQQE